MRNFMMLLFLGILTACQLNTSIRNEESEKLQAQKVTGRLYTARFTKSYNELDSLFSPGFYKEINKEQFNTMFISTDKKFGDIITWDLLSWETLRTNQADARPQYLFTYKVQHEKYDVIEVIAMSKYGHHIKIDRIDFQSKGFMENLKVADSTMSN